MKTTFSRKEAQSYIVSFFQRSAFTPEEMKKIKKLAMKHRIRLGTYKKRFCSKCLSPLSGKIRVTKTHKTVLCTVCGKLNRISLG